MAAALHCVEDLAAVGRASLLCCICAAGLKLGMQIWAEGLVFLIHVVVASLLRNTGATERVLEPYARIRIIIQFLKGLLLHHNQLPD